MSRVFRVTPKRIKRTNGQVLTPDMSVVVTTKTHATSPFTNGAQELKEAYMRLYGFDYQKACCHLSDFDFEVLASLPHFCIKTPYLRTRLTDRTMFRKKKKEAKIELYELWSLDHTLARIISRYLKEFIEASSLSGATPGIYCQKDPENCRSLWEADLWKMQKAFKERRCLAAPPFSMCLIRGTQKESGTIAPFNEIDNPLF